MVGLTFGAVYLVAAALGGSANMAKSVGTAIFEATESTDALADVWLFIVAGAVGAVLAAFAHQGLGRLGADESEEVTS